MGVAFGRFDVRLATGDEELPDEPDPFAPLPACSPGMLTGADGLPYNDFTCMAAGRDGSIWFGTTRGAIRFDGKIFRRDIGIDVSARGERA